MHNRITRQGIYAIQILGFTLKDGDEHSGYGAWTAIEELPWGGFLRIVACGSGGKNSRYPENRDVNQVVFHFCLYDENEDIDEALDSNEYEALADLNRQRAEWVITLLRTRKAAIAFAADLRRASWFQARLNAPHAQENIGDIELPGAEEASLRANRNARRRI